MSARAPRRAINLPLRWSVVAGLLSTYFLASGVLGVAFGREIAHSLDGLAPTSVVTSVSATVFTMTAGLLLASARLLTATAIRIRP